MTNKLNIVFAAAVVFWAVGGGCGGKASKSEQATITADTAVTTFIDSRDGQKYRVVQIGKQVWMAENLRYAVEDSVCYDNSMDSCAKLDEFYTWDIAKTICPAGWRLPSKKDWQELVDFIGDSSTAGTKLRSKTGWKRGGNGTDEYLFSALPYDYDDRHGAWWSATEGSAIHAYFMFMSYPSKGVSMYQFGKMSPLAVRCIQNDKKGDSK